MLRFASLTARRRFVFLFFASIISSSLSAADLPKTMKAVVAHEYGGPEVLKYQDVPVPEPKDNEILVRLIASAELAKNPGYDLRDVAQVLEFASSSHLSSTAQRVIGTKPASLARLRTVDLIDRFVRGHGRSRS